MEAADRATAETIMHQLLLLLCYPFPKVRRDTAEQFYLALTVRADLIQSDDDEGSKHAEAEAILTETVWDTKSIDAVRPKRDLLYACFDLRKPDLVVVGKASK